MVKVRQPRTYQNWVKRKLLDKRVLYNDLTAGRYYLFTVDQEYDMLGEYSLAPIIATTLIYERKISGVNILALPIGIKTFREKILQKFNETEVKEGVKFVSEFLNIKRETQLRSDKYFVSIPFKHIKSKIVEVSKEEIEELGQRVIYGPA